MIAKSANSRFLRPVRINSEFRWIVRSFCKSKDDTPDTEKSAVQETADPTAKQQSDVVNSRGNHII